VAAPSSSRVRIPDKSPIGRTRVRAFPPLLARRPYVAFVRFCDERTHFMTVSTSDAQMLKNAIRSDVKTWHALTFSTIDEAASFVNLDPAQGAGEVSFSCSPDGRIELMYFL
jgi:hypothetical protein